MLPQQVLQPFQVDAQPFGDLAGTRRSRVAAQRSKDVQRRRPSLDGLPSPPPRELVTLIPHFQGCF